MIKEKLSICKDVHILFVFMQGRFAILRHNKHIFSDEEIIKIVEVCVILHNMLIILRIGG